MSNDKREQLKYQCLVVEKLAMELAGFSRKQRGAVDSMGLLDLEKYGHDTAQWMDSLAQALATCETPTTDGYCWIQDVFEDAHWLWCDDLSFVRDANGAEISVSVRAMVKLALTQGQKIDHDTWNKIKNIHSHEFDRELLPGD